jgi:hypothetical protein
VVSFAPRPLYPLENRSRYTLNRTLGGTESQSGRLGEDKKLLPPAVIEPRIISDPIRSLIILPDLSWLLLVRVQSDQFVLFKETRFLLRDNSYENVNTPCG